MAKRAVATITRDLTSVIDFLKQRNILPPAPSQEQLLQVRRIHRATFSLILWKFRIDDLPIHGKVFLEEIASDALQVLPLAMMGYGKTTKLLIRGIIENTLRHIYFIDHPIEFQQMNREEKWFLEMEELFKYPKNHPALFKLEEAANSLTKLSSLYSDLSADVHGRKVGNLEMRPALTAIAYDQHACEAHIDMIEKCAASCNFLLAALYRETMYNWQAEDKSTILLTLSKPVRKIFRNLPLVQNNEGIAVSSTP